MQKYNAINNAGIKSGQKVTLVFQTKFGGFNVLQTTFRGVKLAPHYQYCSEHMNGVIIFNVPKKCRTVYNLKLDYDASLLIYDGWVNIDRDAFMYESLPMDEEQKKSFAFIRKSKYLSFDKRYFTDILAAFPNCLVSDI